MHIWIGKTVLWSELSAKKKHLKLCNRNRSNSVSEKINCVECTRVSTSTHTQTHLAQRKRQKKYIFISWGHGVHRTMSHCLTQSVSRFIFFFFYSRDAFMRLLVEAQCELSFQSRATKMCIRSTRKIFRMGVTKSIDESYKSKNKEFLPQNALALFTSMFINFSRYTSQSIEQSIPKRKCSKNLLHEYLWLIVLPHHTIYSRTYLNGFYFIYILSLVAQLSIHDMTYLRIVVDIYTNTYCYVCHCIVVPYLLEEMVFFFLYRT